MKYEEKTICNFNCNFMTTFVGCNKKVREEDVDFSQLKTNSTIMFRASVSSYGECDINDDFWTGADYTVYYDGCIQIQDNYNLSGDYSAEMQLSDKDYKTLYLFAVNAVNTNQFSETKVDACDGSGWDFWFYDENQNGTCIYSGYTYGVEELEDMQALLRNYRSNVTLVNEEGETHQD